MKTIAFLVPLFLAATSAAQAAYLLDGQRSTVGAYTYWDEYTTAPCPPPPGTPFSGDVGKPFCSFGDGALLDAQGEGLGQAIGLPHNSRDMQVRTVWIDLGQPVAFDALVVRSRLAEWYCIAAFQVACSLDGTTFSEPLTHAGGGAEALPHAPSLAVDCAVPAQGIRARYLRLRFSVPAWNHVEIDEIDIAGRRVENGPPLAAIDMPAFEREARKRFESPAVDEFGQWTRDERPGKIHSEAELLQRHREDEARYPSVNPDPARRDRFGGDKTLGLKAAATGRWRLEKLDGRFWFITPEGYPFLMNAVDGLHCWGPTTIEHRDRPELRKLFAAVPPREDARFGGAWYDDRPGEGIRRFDFYLANRIRIYGDGHVDKFYDTVQRRLVDWGFNGMGKWSEIVHGHVLEKLGRPMPYILPAGPSPEPGIQIPQYGEVFDPWHPHYAAAVDSAVRRIAAEHGKDPYFVGLAFYGEAWWHDGVTEQVLTSVPPLPAKQAFIEQLLGSYGPIAALNAKCGASWAAYDDPLAADLSPFREKLRDDLARFVERSSARFYGAWRQAIDRHDPGRLLLGSCFVLGWLVQPEWVRGSVEPCDAMMLDWYQKDVPGLLKDYVERFAVPGHRPVLIGEFGLTTSREGFKPGLNPCKNQDDRGRWYRYVYENLFAHPHWVGMMYFHYPNQPLPGRDLDAGGEAMQFGLVDVCDRPYEDLLRHVRATNARINAVHAGKMPAMTKQELGLQ